MPTSESVIRWMTRLAVQHDAVNLSQGFTDEPPAYDLVWDAITAMLGGTETGVRRLGTLSLAELAAETGQETERLLAQPLREDLGRL